MNPRSRTVPCSSGSTQNGTGAHGRQSIGSIFHQIAVGLVMSRGRPQQGGRSEAPPAARRAQGGVGEGTNGESPEGSMAA